jgi:uncharacterized protein with HEPN domain
MPDIEWRRVVGLRNVLIHGYRDVDVETVWWVVDSAVPQLLAAIQGRSEGASRTHQVLLSGRVSPG